MTEDRASAICRALSHPVRRELLSGLLGGECDVSYMTDNSGVGQPTVSKHLAMLRQAGLVTVRVDGRRRCYSLAQPEVVLQLLELLRKLEAGETVSGEPVSGERDAS
jgi:DNA-binding transcriptional ArsR family regulator